MRYRATVKLDHESGPVTIEVTGSKAEVAAFVANSIRGHFQRPGAKEIAKPVTSSDREFYDFLRDFFRLRRG